MTVTTKLVVEHNGTVYEGKRATITHTQLGFEHFGGVSATLYTDSTAAVGGYTLDDVSRDVEGRSLGRYGTAYGMDHLMRILQTVGVDRWEQLPSREIIVVLADGDTARNAQPLGLANEGGKVLIFKDHADGFNEDQPGVVADYF